LLRTDTACRFRTMLQNTKAAFLKREAAFSYRKFCMLFDNFQSFDPVEMLNV